MKENEEIARLRIQEAIQTGLRAQQIHRALQEGKPQHRPAAFDAKPRADHRDPKPRIWYNWLRSPLLSMIIFFQS